MGPSEMSSYWQAFTRHNTLQYPLLEQALLSASIVYQHLLVYQHLGLPLRHNHCSSLLTPFGIHHTPHPSPHTPHPNSACRVVVTVCRGCGRGWSVHPRAVFILQQDWRCWDPSARQSEEGPTLPCGTRVCFCSNPTLPTQPNPNPPCGSRVTLVSVPTQRKHRDRQFTAQFLHT